MRERKEGGNVPYTGRFIHLQRPALILTRVAPFCCLPPYLALPALCVSVKKRFGRISHALQYTSL